VVTYTMAEGACLADVLTPGHPSTDWTSYQNGWGDLRPLVGPDGPSLKSDRAGAWAVADIGKAKAVLVKSDLHPSTDGEKLPMVQLWQQMIAQVKPSLVITTGTAGGVGATTELGDVIVTGSVRWDATTKFAGKSWAHTTYTSDAGQAVLSLSTVQALLQLAQSELMPANLVKVRTGPAQILGGTTITTDFFAFDDEADTYGLRTYEPTARAVEMDDAALGLACSSMATPPPWLSIRNASDPQMSGANVHAEDVEAADIYKRYGYDTTSCSAIACWAIIAGLIT
jgi:nucleoside phosphorylase